MCTNNKRFSAFIRFSGILALFFIFGVGALIVEEQRASIAQEQAVAYMARLTRLTVQLALVGDGQRYIDSEKFELLPEYRTVGPFLSAGLAEGWLEPAEAQQIAEYSKTREIYLLEMADTLDIWVVRDSPEEKRLIDAGGKI